MSLSAAIAPRTGSILRKSFGAAGHRDAEGLFTSARRSIKETESFNFKLGQLSERELRDEMAIVPTDIWTTDRCPKAGDAGQTPPSPFPLAKGAKMFGQGRMAEVVWCVPDNCEEAFND